MDLAHVMLSATFMGLVAYINMMVSSKVVVTWRTLGIAGIQSTLVISNSKGLPETLRDVRTSIYPSCGSEENNKSNNHI